MAFDPPLGSTSPAVLLDNATRLDELVNGPAGTVNDRAGQPLDTWRQIVTMMLAAVTDAQNSITAIGLPFNTLSDAQAAVAAGKIPDGSVTWVRTTDSAALADEYKNINGVLTATGRRMPSQDAVDALSRQLLDSIVTGDVPGFWLALKDSAGWISWGVDDQGGFGSRAAYLGTDNILAGNIKILFTDDVGLRFQDPEGFYIDVLDNFGRYLLGDSGGGSSPVDEVSILDLKNKAYAAEVSRRVLTRLKFPTEAYNHFLMECQSLGMGFMCWPAVSKTPKYSNLMFGSSVRPASTTANAFTPLGGTAWQPLKAVVQSTGGGTILTDADQQALDRSAVNEGESPVVAAVNGFRRHFLETHCLNSDPSRLFVASAVGVSGQSIENLMDDTKYYNRLVECVTKAKALADSEGKSYSVTAIEFVQGERNYELGTSKASYKSLLGQLRNKIFATIRGITGQTSDPAWFMYQTGFTYSPNPATQPLNAIELWVGMAQYEFCLENENCFMVGPNYQLPDKGGHLMTNGSRWLGCYFAKAKDRVLNQRRPFQPLAPIDFKCDGLDIFVSYYVDYPPLQFQSPFRGGVRTVITNKGFRVFSNVQNDPAGIGEEITVGSVEIAADTIIKITCATEPQGLIRVVYGTYPQYGQGMVTDSDNYVPDEVYEYDPQFTQWPEENISELIGKPYPMENWSIAFSMTFNKDE
ncbi:hypothetical protein [Klebsiella pneumoniae]|uniref:hypothetical protein n=1 Tax=Klebsiella pneumoniae TaxID=573 RepID=UPI000808C204|nr:hypothetical protein [Klebsiella pneumoniae]MDZ1369690.1 hypothetical protein [Klebsiella pneumoniae]CAJ1258669.1 hypothetical protein JRT4AKPX_JRT4AKP_01756 [Klebsiella pneumoniae]SBX62509.1 flagellar biosynthesis, cell-distal portion of basal-body rod [Klebsiella pneumoniae]SVL81831.1 flagellar biosynthesis, cell-distal portion of basal-body rod [Klebsiella pneumoniae]SXT65632.1 flagellar biosynthesis, cell-distal portion of basal-body rod [Klebsiella pneumoniae]